ncbi:DNA gyrase/topoisomerase IV subunit A [Fibrobacter sp. UWEL]|uniref:DNA gyrase/topoisomerase IV subunit A n=1 Tax=Fibrobacter sp. UWEL TaxID=1896209 RepID=UPI000923A680|nr:DNA gyrase/topoisomerase IV subunit A [Fibrobacter sp. UWEL]SHK49677.1 topoisomerase-4 subunit A [Fibrobacter sp. UWEL]
MSEERQDSTLGLSNVNHLEKLYNGWFLDYASYVILDRAVPYFEDGLKPVQRRILHSLFENHDGRYQKVATIVGRTMAYHPHGDASIGDALVGLGQKGLLIDTQGNWGNPFTGDRAAAPRYIEGRLTPFAVDVVFNPETTEWIPSYDGRSEEPVTLPVKFPLLLAQGVDGIAVGLSTYILPHNFRELCQASIDYLRGKKVVLYPDFFTGGIIDVSDYNDGQRGGKVKVRAKIEKVDNKTLAIKEIPYGTTTVSLIESIVKANEKGKIKIKHVDDNTSQSVEILIHLQPGTDPQVAMNALYAFTDCEKSLSPCTCVIVDKHPKFLGVSEILKMNTDHTVQLLKWELENERKHLDDKWHMTSLEKIFIEKKVYQVIENAKSRDEMVQLIDDGLKPYIKHLRREVTQEEILKLAEIPIRRISRFDRKKADELLAELDASIQQNTFNQEHITDYTIDHFKNILKKYGEGKERKSEIAEFGKVEAVHVAIANQKLYVNRKEGFLGTGMKKEEYLFDVSEYDDLIVFKADGSFKVVKVSDKDFVGKDIILVEKFKKDDDRHIYNVIHLDGKDGAYYIKRFNVGGVTRDKDYFMGKGKPGSKILYMSSNMNGEAEVVEVTLKPRPRTKLNFEVDFSTIEVKGRGAMGNIVTKYPVKSIKRLRKGVSTLGARVLYFDAPSGVISTQKKGDRIGEFGEKDKILIVKENGSARVHDMADPIIVGTGIKYIHKYDPTQIFSILYFEGGNFNYMVKRFNLDGCPMTTEFNLISDHKDSKMIEFFASNDAKELMEYQVGREVQKEELDLTEVAEIKGYKALGSKFTAKKVKRVSRISPADSFDDGASESDDADDAEPSLF